MRVSQQLSKTLREAPRDSEGGNQELLVRAGFIRQLTSGVYSFLPLGQRVSRKIMQIVREEMDAAGGQEVSLPIIQPREFWEKPPLNGPSRAEAMGEMLFTLRDRRERAMVLAPTHEEVVNNLVAEFARSYRDLPQLVYQIQTKFRDEPRPRGGLLRVREFLMKDLYSFDADAQGMDLSYRKVAQAYRRIFDRIGLHYVVAAFLRVPAARTMKVVCYAAGGRVILALVRGDLEINEVKLTNIIYRAGLNAADLRLADAEELVRAGIVAGFTSPLDKGRDVLIIADTSLRQGQNFVAGANKVDYHLKNVNYPRDFRVDIWEDLAAAFDGALCARCGGPLHAERGTEVGHIFKVGTKYADLFDTTFLDAAGEAHPLLMGCYGLGIGRTLAALVEQSHDEKGLIWPFSVAPYHVHLLGLDLDKAEHRALAEQLYADLKAAGVEVLYDDRFESAGIKFNDADLLGLPLRAVISKRSLKNGGVELKLRAESSRRIVPLSAAVKTIQDEVRQEREVLPMG